MNVPNTPRARLDAAISQIGRSEGRTTALTQLSTAVATSQRPHMEQIRTVLDVLGPTGSDIEKRIRSATGWAMRAGFACGIAQGAREVAALMSNWGADCDASSADYLLAIEETGKDPLNGSFTDTEQAVQSATEAAMAALGGDLENGALVGKMLLLNAALIEEASLILRDLGMRHGASDTAEPTREAEERDGALLDVESRYLKALGDAEEELGAAVPAAHAAAHELADALTEQYVAVMRKAYTLGRQAGGSSALRTRLRKEVR